MPVTKTRPKVRKRQTRDERLIAQAEKRMPSAERMAELAKKYPPPQSWYDEEWEPARPATKRK
jgi:hypothetical protein